MEERVPFFDFIAWLLACFVTDCKYFGDGDAAKTHDVSSGERKEMDTIFSAFHIGSTDENLFRDYVLNGIPKKLHNTFINSRLSKSKAAAFQLTRKLTNCYLNRELILEYSRRLSENCPGFGQLNTDASRRETGILLLPKMITFGEENEILATDSTRLSRLTFNQLIVVQESDLRLADGNVYEIHNIVLPADSEYISSEDELRIAVTPLSRDMLLNCSWEEIESDEEVSRVFTVNSLKDETYINHRFMAAFQAAAKNKANIMLAPEMYGTNAIAENLESLMPVDAHNMILINVTPSVWHDYSNVANVYDPSAEKLFSQWKQHDFYDSHEESGKRVRYAEDLRKTDRGIYIYHWPGVGRLAVCICKDFLLQSYRRLLTEVLGVSILLIPAFSQKKEDFINCMDELRQTRTYGVFVDCCAAWLEAGKEPQADDYVGEVFAPWAKGPGTPSSFEFLSMKCNGNCGRDNDSCLFMISINRQSSIIKVEHVCRGGEK